MLSPYDEIERVSLTSIRDIFNKSQYPRQIKNGTLKPRIIRDNHLDKPQEVGEPWCTHSQFIRYCDNAGNWLVEIHQYWRSRDNTIGGCGFPDPKRLKIASKIIIADARIT